MQILYKGDYPIFFHLPKFYFKNKNVYNINIFSIIEKFYNLQWYGNYKINDKVLALFFGNIPITIYIENKNNFLKKININDLSFDININVILNYINSIRLNNNLDNVENIDIIPDFSYPTFPLNKIKNVKLKLEIPYYISNKKTIDNISNTFQNKISNLPIIEISTIPRLKIKDKNLTEFNIKNLIFTGKNNLYYFILKLEITSFFEIYKNFYNTLKNLVNDNKDFYNKDNYAIGITFFYFKILK